jgi:hypothetical protein
MTNASTFTILLLAGSLGFAGCGGKQKPVAQTTTQTKTVTQDNTGETNKTVVTETKTEQADGSQTVKRTEATEHTSPPPPTK